MYVDPRYFAVSTSSTVWYEDFVDILGGGGGVITKLDYI